MGIFNLNYNDNMHCSHYKAHLSRSLYPCITTFIFKQIYKNIYKTGSYLQPTLLLFAKVIKSYFLLL